MKLVDMDLYDAAVYGLIRWKGETKMEDKAVIHFRGHSIECDNILDVTIHHDPLNSPRIDLVAKKINAYPYRIAPTDWHELPVFHPYNKYEIRKVIFSEPVTTVIWADGTKTHVRCENEEFDKEKGLAMCVAKKALGNKGRYYDEFKKWIEETD